MQCGRCSGETPAGKPFCANCGAPLANPCSSCGAELTAGKAFCADCGAPSGLAAPSGREPAPATDAVEVSERRLCSVLFVDLVGFTPLAEKADPEAVRELLSRYFDRANAIISSYGGTIEKFIGDAVMALWGAPVANEDDAERAVRAGLEVVASVAELGRTRGSEGLAARAGIVTGEVAVVVGKVAEGMVTGDTVNAASRVQAVAEPGTVLVDETTWRASSDAIAYAAIGELVLKGKSETLTAWRALRVVGQRKGLGRSERLEPPFVGRHDELQLVKDLLQATARERRARLVSVTGLPGIGKSRLAWEFLKYVDGLADTVYWHQGRSAAYGAGVTFGALGEMVRMRAGISEAEEPEVARAKLADAVAEYVPDEDERAWIESRLLHLLGLTEAPTTDREELFGAWRTFFERIAAVGLAVLVFEDLQWADPGLIDFIESILEWSRSHSIMIVTLSRPELRDLRPDWGAGQRSFTSLHLDPLSDDEMDELLAGFVHGLPAEVNEKVRDRAEGVPLYAVEIVRMLVDRGVLVDEGGAYVVRGELAELEVPETLHALVASRLDSLPTEQRALVQDAAVLGTVFQPETLAIVHGAARDTIEPMLRDLVRKEFLRLDSDPRSPERGQYGFVQGVIGDVALSMLSRRDRSTKHLAVARHCESLHDDELIAIIAAQYASAFRAAPEDEANEELAASAGTWLTRAGNRAASLGSPEQALDLYTEALELVREPAERATLLEAASEAAMHAVRFDRGREYAFAAIAIFEEIGDHDGAGRAACWVARSYTAERRNLECSEFAISAYEALDESVGLSVRAALATVIANSFGQGLDMSKALWWSEIALAYAEELGDASRFVGALGSRAGALFGLGRHREAIMLALGMKALAADAGDFREEAGATMGLGLFYLPDDPRAALSAAYESAEICRRNGLRGLERTNLLNAAEVGIDLGTWSESRRILEEVSTEGSGELESWLQSLLAMLDAMSGDVARADERLPTPSLDIRDLEFVSGATTVLHAAAIVRLAAGDLVEAQGLATTSIEIDPSGINVAFALHVLGHAALWQRDLAAARAALAAGPMVRGRFIEAVRQTIKAGICAIEGEQESAAKEYNVAFESWRVLDCTLPLALAELDSAVLLDLAHRGDADVAEAREIFEQLRARPFLQRLDAALTS